MGMRQRRLQFVNDFLKSLGPLRPFVASSRDERIFELYCYFKKVAELVKRGKTPRLRNVTNNVFAPHSKPGNAMAASYISLEEPNCETFDLFLNGRFSGKSGARHSPDIVLMEENSGKILSIYECKNHSGPLELTNYREFIGYLEEMKLPRRAQATIRNLYPEMRPCIYTSAVSRLIHACLQEEYDFSVVDGL